MSDVSKRERLLSGMTFLVLTGMLFLGAFLSRSDLPIPSLCLVKNNLLFDCPGCGLTRSFLRIARGDFSSAWHLNAASLFLYLLFFTVWFREGAKAFGFTLPNPKWLQASTKILSYLTAIFLFGHWLLKMYFYFSERNIIEYLRLLKSNWFM